MKDMETNSEHNSNLKNSILERISSEKVLPRSRWIFQSREAMVWSLWALSVLVGAFAVAVTLFVLTYRQYALYEATHENFYTFMIEVLPYVWFLIFALMAFAAVYNLRHTKHGYRYPVWQILGSGLALSFAGGAMLHIGGFGYAIDHELGERMTAYNSQDKIELRMWQSPQNGRLVGHLVAKTTAAEQAIFEDTKGNRWVFTSSELPRPDLDLLQSKKMVRILGTATNPELKLFHACGVFPIDDIEGMRPEKLGIERQKFIASAKEYMFRLEKDFEPEETGESAEEIPKAARAESVCANLEPIQRIGKRQL